MAHILVIDDDEGVRLPLCTALQMAGYTVHEAGDGQEGLDLYRSLSPDLVITDIRMPVKDGIQTIQELRQEAPDIKIIVMVGEQDDAFPEIESLNVSSTIEKPFSLQEIVQTVGKLLAE